MPEADGSISLEDGRYVIRFERRFDRPVEEVWSAITEPARLQKWVGANEVEIELVAGGRMVTRTTGPKELVEAIIAEGGSPETRDTVLRVEPPRLLEHTFGGAPDSVVRWELEPSGGGCLLRLAHTEPADFNRTNGPRDLAGWHELLDLLREHIEAGEAMRAWSMERWESYKARYENSVGND